MIPYRNKWLECFVFKLVLNIIECVDIDFVNIFYNIRALDGVIKEDSMKMPTSDSGSLEFLLALVFYRFFFSFSIIVKSFVKMLFVVSFLRKI